MKRSRSPIIVRVTMSQKDKSVKRIDDEQQGGTAIDSKKPLETNVDDVAPPVNVSFFCQEESSLRNK